MSTWTSPITWVASTTLTAAQLNTEVRDHLNWLKGALSINGITSDTARGQVNAAIAGCRVSASAALSIVTATTTNLTYNTEAFDTDAFHSLVTNTERITVPANFAGIYAVGAYVSWDSGATGYRRMFIQQNGTTNLTGQTDTPTAGPNWIQSCNTIVVAAAADYFTVVAEHTQGTNLQVLFTTFWAVRLGSQS